MISPATPLRRGSSTKPTAPTGPPSSSTSTSPMIRRRSSPSSPPRTGSPWSAMRVVSGSGPDMAILILTSAGGSPGVTTLALGLALTWPRPVLLVDGDPGAHQAVLAGYLHGQSSSGKGLLRVAEAHRDRRPLREVVIDQCLPLTGEDGDRRLFLPGFTRPGSASHFGTVWEDLADTFDRLGDVDLDVIVDAGRVGANGLPGPLVERGALTALLLGSTLR